jgi:hypothetical protein
LRVLLVGAGGVGTALARIAARRPFTELVIADYDLARARYAAPGTATRPGDFFPLIFSPGPGCRRRTACLVAMFQR